MTVLSKMIFHISILDWLTAGCLAATTFVVLILARKYVGKKLGAFAATTETKLDDLAVSLINGTSIVSLLLISLFVGSLVLTLTAKADIVVEKVLVVTLLFQGALWSNH